MNQFKIISVILFASIFGLQAQSAVDKGLSAFEAENWDEAQTYFQDAIAEDPENPQLHFNLGAATYKKEQFEEALKSFEKALATREVPLQQQTYYNIGNSYFRMDKFEKSIEAYKKSLDLVPEDEDVKFNLEMARIKMKEMAEQQEQEQQDDQEQEQQEPSEFAKQLKEEAERLVAQRLYKDAYNLMVQGINLDPSVQAFQDFIQRIGEIVEIEESI